MDKDPTLAIQAGRATPIDTLAPPVYRASTVVYPTTRKFAARHQDLYDHITYGAYGSPTAQAFETAIAALEGGGRALSVASGLGAIAMVNMAVLKSGDQVLLPDSIYGPVREFCAQALAPLGIDGRYYDPTIGADIAALIGPTTRLIWLESPGSITMEVQDVPAIAQAARAAGVLSAMDATWATPLGFKPLRHGVDFSVHAASKYIGGHSDLILGVITVAKEAHYRRLKDVARLYGCSAAPDNCFLAQRGLSSLDARLHRHAQSGLAVARWLATRPEVAHVLHPALPDHPTHALFARDYQRAGGVFSIVLRPAPIAAMEAMLDGMRIFRIGASWGGPHSLVAPNLVPPTRSVTGWPYDGPIIRLHIGLEALGDLIDDLTAGFARWHAAQSASDDDNTNTKEANR